MKKLLKISTIAVMAFATQSYAGGELLPVTEFEVNDVQEAVKAVEVIKVPMAPKKVEAPKVVPVVKEKQPWYAGVGLVGAKVDNGNCEDITYGAMAKVGYDFNDYIGVEARGLKTNWKYEGAKIKHYAAFLKPQYPITKDLKLYGLLGYGKTIIGDNFILDDNGFAFGGGLDYDLGESDAFSLFADYERLLQKSNVPDLDALSLGLAYKF